MRLRSSREIQHFRNVMDDIQRRNSSSISGIRYEDDVLSRFAGALKFYSVEYSWR